jgi:hypothetical protein
MGTTRAKRMLEPPSGPVSLKTLAAYLDLDPTTVSVVLNEVPGRSIPEATRERIRKAALKFNYQPSFLARSLRNRRTMTIGILVPVLADGYHAEVMTGIGDSLLEEKYFYFIAHHRHRADLIEQYPRMLISRGAEGLITIDTNLVDKLPLPVVAIAGHRCVDGVTISGLLNFRFVIFTTWATAPLPLCAGSPTVPTPTPDGRASCRWPRISASSSGRN